MTRKLGLGKVTKEVFDRCVKPHLPLDKETELDGATVKFTEETVIAHSPSIGVPLEALGFFAFHYSACNVACKFGRPSHMITGIYMPLDSTEEQLTVIAENLGHEATRYGVKIIAGQTATYSGLDIPLVTTSCMGEHTRTPAQPEKGDTVLLVGEIGGEAVWLQSQQEQEPSTDWRRFTPLPVILALQDMEQVKVMHDVSEGGVTSSLLEVTDSLGFRLEIQSKSLAYAKDVQELISDPLRAPSYGALIVVSAPEGVQYVKNLCTQLGLPCVTAGSLKTGEGLHLDGEQVTERKRVDADELYGSFRQ